METVIKIPQPGGLQGRVTVRSHPAGTVVKIQALRAEGKHEEADVLLKKGKLEVEQDNIIVWSLNCGFDIIVQFLISAFNGIFSITNNTSITGTTDGSTAVITGLTSTTGLAAGMGISGAGIPPYSTVISVDSSSQITISQNTTVAATSPLYFVQNNQLGIQWGEIGTGNTTPTNTDTALSTPTNRTIISYALDSGYNAAEVQFLFADGTLANGTYYEFGTFVGGSSTIGTGNMFNHALFATPYVKTSGVDSTVQVTFSLSNT